jgi:hypothetical protein
MPRKPKKEDAPTQEQEQPKGPPIKTTDVTKENPTGIEEVRPDVAKHFGTLRGATGGPGAAGAVVGGPIHYVATQGGTKPLPVDGEASEEGGAEATDQPTSQQSALKAHAESEDPPSPEEQRAPMGGGDGGSGDEPASEE